MPTYTLHYYILYISMNNELHLWDYRSRFSFIPYHTAVVNKNFAIF